MINSWTGGELAAALGEAEVLRLADAGGRGVVVQVQERRVAAVQRRRVVRGGEYGVGGVRRRLMLAFQRGAAQDELRAVRLGQLAAVVQVPGAVALVAALALLLEHQPPPLGARVLEPHLQYPLR